MDNAEVVISKYIHLLLSSCSFRFLSIEFKLPANKTLFSATFATIAGTVPI